MTKSKSQDKAKSTQEKNKSQDKIKQEQIQPEIKNEPDFDWTPENEVQLFYALRGHKPVGIARHFQMICILEAFVNSTSKDVSSSTIWKHLDELYDMDTLNENEDLKSLKNDVEFTLEGNPDFEELLKKKE